MLKTEKLGNTTLKVTDFSLGGAAIGNLYAEVSDEVASDTLNQAWQQGIRYFDVAPEYGYGLAERRFGDFLRQHPSQDFVLSTKVGLRLQPYFDKKALDNKFINPLPFKGEHDYSYTGVMRSLEDSLQRLGLNSIDLVLIHDLDHICLGDRYDYYFRQTFEKRGGYAALNELRSQGVIKAVGMGVKQWQCCQQALKFADFDCFMLQGNYTLLEQSALQTFLPLCERRQISILLAGPFCSGILAGAMDGQYYFNQQLDDDKVIAKVKQMTAICQAYQIPLAACALQFPLLHPAITSVVASARHADEIKQNCENLTRVIPDDLWQDLLAADLLNENVVLPLAGVK